MDERGHLTLSNLFRRGHRPLHLLIPAVLALVFSALSLVPAQPTDHVPSADGTLGLTQYGSYLDRLGYPPFTPVVGYWSDEPDRGSGVILSITGPERAGEIGVPLRASPPSLLTLGTAVLLAMFGCLSRRRAPLIGLPIALIAVSVFAAECLFAAAWPAGLPAFAAPPIFVALVATIPAGGAPRINRAVAAVAGTTLLAAAGWLTIERLEVPFDHAPQLSFAWATVWLVTLLRGAASDAWSQARGMVRTGWHRDMVVALSESALVATDRYRLMGAEEERRRLSDELHADVLPLIGRTVDGQRSIPDGELGDAERHLRAMLSERQTVILDALGLGAAIDQLVYERAARGPAITANVASASTRPPRAVELVAYRIVQQAIDNAITHAQAERVMIDVPVLGVDRLELSVRDDGVGLEATEARRSRDRAHIGLLSMRQSATSVGGAFRIRSGDHGTEVAFVWSA